MDNFYKFLFDGGPLVIPIILCSLISLTFFLERLSSLKKNRIIPPLFIERIENMLKENRISDTLLLCKEYSHPMAKIMVIALENATKSREQITSLVEDKGRYESSILQKYIEVIGTCATISPLLGLLGTVLGMIKVFKNISDHSQVDPSLLATGIWEALITTAIGLSVAIPSFIFYKYLNAHVENLVIEMEERVLHLVNIIVK